MKQLKHLDHVEDLILMKGSAGLDKALYICEHMISEPKSHKVSVKIDGAPSVIAGWDFKGEFFVATKSLFNKTPKINYSIDDIRKNHGHSIGLENKLVYALTYFKDIIPKGRIFQGDILFTAMDVKSFIDDEGCYVSIKPNTIEYRTRNRKEINAVRYAKIGVVWHTAYFGSRIDDLEALISADVSCIKANENVYVAKTDFIDKYGKSDFNNMEISGLFAYVNAIEMKMQRLKKNDADIDNIFNEASEVSALAMQFINARLREGKTFINKEESLLEFINFSRYKYNKVKLTSKSAIDANEQKYMDLYSFILYSPGVRRCIMEVFELHYWLQCLKQRLIEKLNLPTKDYKWKCFIDDKETNHEGFVVTNNFSSVKFVDRMEFSRANFNNSRF